MDSDMPGYFVLGGESYGYQYDLFKAYADYLGVELKIVGGTASGCRRMMEAGEVDIMTTLSDHVSDEELPSAVPVYRTSYVLLGSRGKAAEARRLNEHFVLTSFLKGSRLLVSDGFKSSGTYDMMLDSLPETDIYASSRNSFELIEQLAGGRYDFVICEMSEAQLGCAFMRNVEQIYTFADRIPVSAVVSAAGSGMLDDFRNWLERFRRSEEYAVLNYLYFEKGIVRHVMGRGLRAATVGGISPYDEIFREVCGREGYDWRLVSAIAYNESRFNPYVISRKGARGLMQIMPRVARQFGMEGNIMEPSNNILLAVKVLGKIERSLDFAPETPAEDRIRIVLACYNAGIGHVKDARSLARKFGANPDSWRDVSTYLSMKADPEIAEDEAVRCGRFNGRETLAFVDGVLDRYKTYCNNVER